MIFRPELVEKIFAGEIEAAKILEPGYVGSVRRDPPMASREPGGVGEYHQGQAARHRAVLEALIATHEARAAKLMDVQPEGAACRTFT